MNGLYKDGAKREAHGLSKSAEYRVWMGVKGRCLNPRNTAYQYYGGRGITICSRWESFCNFYSDMGQRPSSEHSIDRIDSNGHYEPSNCRWATRLVQQRNTRRARMVAIGDNSVHVGELECAGGLNRITILKRIENGCTVEEAVSLPRFAKQVRKPSSSQYQGVCFDRERQRWLAFVKVGGRMVNLGRYETELEAAFVREIVIFNGINGQPNFNEHEIRQLRKRFPHKYNQHDVLNRDLAAERQVLEAT